MTTAPAPAARPLAAGARIAGKLELVRPVGEGGMGAVWVARNLKTGGQVAVKMLGPSRRNDDHAAERFRYEAKLGATLNHRNITRVFDLVEEDDGSLVLVMELLQGETLASFYKRKGSLATREAVAIVVPLLSALQHAHELGVVHRDLKPSNIVLHVDPDGQVTPKLLDFGIAKAEDSSIETRTGDALGTPQYMSPEQVRATPLDGRSDLFSIAVVLYEIITGQNPFQGPTSSAVLAQVLEQEIDPDPAIDPRVWLELRRALSKQPYQRHASAKELAAALCSAVGETEAALVRSLRASEPPPPPAVDQAPPPSAVVDVSPTQRDVDPPRFAPHEGVARRRASRLRIAYAALGLTFALFAAAFLFVRGRATKDPSSVVPESTGSSLLTSSAATSGPDVVGTPEPALSFELSASDPASSASKVGGAPARRVNRARPHKPPAPTGPTGSVAQTPGF